jgi:hypothetical protein
MDSRIDIKIYRQLGPNLALRDTAISLFDLIEALSDHSITIDFSGVESISRSFADEYVKRKASSHKNIKERNVPQNVVKMLDIVTKPSNGQRFKDLDKAKIIVL